MSNTGLFFISLIPPEPYRSQVMAFKKEVQDKFNSKAALRSPPHITLHMPFQWREDREDILKENLDRFRFDQFPFEIELKDFDFFEPRVVFVNVMKSVGLVQLQKELVGFVRRELNIFNADYKDKPFHPHMTIGFRDLKKSVFPEVKEYYSSKNYSVEFEVNNICLLKHNGKTWDEWFYFS